jgi:tetratricopeptide (TPR) repeat protein
MDPTARPEPSPVEAEILRIRGLMEKGQFAEALPAAEAVAAQHPRNRDALYMVAVSQRYLQRIPDALATLERLEQAHPRFSRLFQERGHCHIALRDAPNAIAAFTRAVNLNPALPVSWQKLEILYRMTGQADNARTAAEHVATLANLPSEIVNATGFFSDGDLTVAEQIVRQYLMRHGNDVEAMRLLARIGLELDVLDDGELLLEAVLEMAPDYHAARFDYARVLLRRHKHQAAIEQLERLLKHDPDNRFYKTTYATTFVGLGQHERALELYQELLVDAPKAADLHLSIAHTLKTLGRTPEAIAAYRDAAAARPDFGDAYWSLANLKTYQFDDAQIATMRQAEAGENTQLVDRYHLCFALGKALEDHGRYAESFEYYERGNALKKSESHYRVAVVERNTREQVRVCTPELFERFAGTGNPAPDPIFIIGLPRSGSTLLEQILASHSQVDGTAELADIQRIVLELSGREMTDEDSRYPAILPELAPEALRRYGDQYLADTRVYRSGKPFFIDKMPNNFRHVGLIHLILPNAKIIDARREPMACCFSNFKQLFASGQEFTYSLEDIARYYRTYVEVMDHWDRVLPGRVLRVQHEDVVADLEGNVRRILDYCGLPFEQGCLEFHKTERSIRTASSEQVRRPIFKEGLDQWRHYEPWLAPLRTALGDAANG